MPAPSAAEMPTPTGDRLGDWAGWTLHVACQCKSGYWPVDLLIKNYGHARRVRDVTDRMRCQHCRQPPRELYLTDRPEGDQPRGICPPRREEVPL